MTTGDVPDHAVELLDSTAWSEVSDDELGAQLLTVERSARRLEAVRGAMAAEFAARQERVGRSLGSACERLGGRLGVPAGEVRSRVESARRSGTPARTALEEGCISATQEKAVAAAIDGLAESEPGEVRRDFAERYTSSAERGTPPHALSRDARSELAARYPVDPLERERLQSVRRSAHCGSVGRDGMSTLLVSADPRLRALFDAVLARFGEPGACLGGAAGPATGRPAGATVLAASDDRSPEQRAHDALAHVLHLGLGAEPSRAQGVATIVVRVSPEQLDALDARRGDRGTRAGRSRGRGGRRTMPGPPRRGVLAGWPHRRGQPLSAVPCPPRLGRHRSGLLAHARRTRVARVGAMGSSRHAGRNPTRFAAA